MPTPYSTAAQVKDKDLSRQVAQATWVDADVEDRIVEGDAVIDGYLAGFGYDLPFAANPTLVTRLSILYGKYACLRDLHHHFSPSQAGGEGYEGYKKQFDALIESLRKGEISLVDAVGDVVDPVAGAEGMRVHQNMEDVPRSLNMGDPESQSIDTAEYTEADRLGNPD
jgi:hypothetical protein